MGSSWKALYKLKFVITIICPILEHIPPYVFDTTLVES